MGSVIFDVAQLLQPESVKVIDYRIFYFPGDVELNSAPY